METTTDNLEKMANQLIDWCNQGDYDKAYQELYSPNIVSIEAESNDELARVEGMEGIMKKGEWWEQNFEVHSSVASDPVVAEGYFTVKFTMDTTHKPSGQRAKSSEIGVYKVDNGKIVKETFFYKS